MNQESSSEDRRSNNKRRSSNRRVSTQRERNDDDEYDHHANHHRNHKSHATHHHNQDDGSSKKRSSRAKVRPPSPETARPPSRSYATAIVDDDSTISVDDEKWHKKTWVRIMMGVIVIVFTVMITFFVLRATGLGLNKSAAIANGDASNAPSAVESSAPSSAPTPVPFFTYAAPDEDSCDEKSFETGDTSFVDGENTREFDFTFDVTMSFADSSGLWLQEFESKVNSALIPILVGCIDDDDDDDEDDRRLQYQERASVDMDGQLRGLHKASSNGSRRLDSDEMKFRYVIADATVIGMTTADLVCPQVLDSVSTQQDPRQGLPEICFRVSVNVDLLLRGEERVFSLVQLITTILSELSDPEQSLDESAVPVPTCTSLLDCMELTSPFKKIAVVGVTNRDPTNSPSTSPSQVPTNRPSTMPTNIPSMPPSLFPTEMPSLKPSFSPTSRPSPGPTLAPSRMPSIEPSFTPTDAPSTPRPTFTPQPSSSFGPSMRPTQMPSCADFWEPQDTDNQVIDPNDPPDTNCESEDENN